MAARGGKQPAKAREADQLELLGADLARAAARVRRLSHKVKVARQTGDEDRLAAISEDWSRTMDKALQLAGAIAQLPANDVHDLVVKFEAIWWFLVEDDNVLDASAMRWMRRFRRSLRSLGRPPDSA